MAAQLELDHVSKGDIANTKMGGSWERFEGVNRGLSAAKQWALPLSMVARFSHGTLEPRGEASCSPTPPPESYLFLATPFLGLEVLWGFQTLGLRKGYLGGGETLSHGHSYASLGVV